MRDKPRFSTVADWHNYLVQMTASGSQIDGAALYSLRQAAYRDIEEYRGRPLIVYAARFPDAPPQSPISIDQSDVDGFTDLVASIPDSEEVDVIVHSPGGAPDSTERIVSILRSKFRFVGFLVPHSAYSAATMLALSGNQIVLHPSAVLGPIDPQINGTPARSIRRGFDRVRELLKEEGPEALPAYIPLLEKHSLELLEICDDSLSLSKELATEWLTNYMFDGEPNQTVKIETAVEFFSNHDTHKTHSRPLSYAKLKPLDLRIELSGEPLTGLLREVHILLSGFFGTAPFVKVFENSRGLSWGRQFQILPAPISPHVVKKQQVT